MKVAFVFICLNENYWPFVGRMVESARTHFLPGHEVDYFFWSDMPSETTYGATVFPTEPVEWPLPTLFRYHLFLQQEETLAKYDYIFYADADMLFVNKVGDEILGEGLTGALHPMYAVSEKYRNHKTSIPPFEPNPLSSAYVHEPFPKNYYAGGFQGGKSADFITAMKVMRKRIDQDFFQNYVARWNDESHWNRYLVENPPSVTLSPSYVYPDSLIVPYYVPIWGRPYLPRLVTLTKAFTANSVGAQAIQDIIKTL